MAISSVQLGAQENAEKGASAVPEPKSGAIDAPPPKSEADKSAAESNPGPKPSVTSPLTIEQQRETDEAGEERKDTAEQRDKDDLEAQQEMAKAASDLVEISWWQLGVGFLALVGLAFTVHYTRKTAIAATDAVTLASETAERQLRAYLVGTAAQMDKIDGGFMLSAVLKNTGQTPAFNARIMGESFAADYPLEEDRPHPEPSTEYAAPIGAGEEVHAAYRISAEYPDDVLSSVVAGEIGLWIQGTAIYEDCFGKSHRTKFRYVFGGRLAKGAGIIMHADREGNEAD